MNYDTFRYTFMDLLNDQARVKKKCIRANNAGFMSKRITKAIMNRSRLKNKFHSNPNKDNWNDYKKQRNYCVNVLRRRKW